MYWQSCLLQIPDKQRRVTRVRGVSVALYWVVNFILPPPPPPCKLYTTPLLPPPPHPPPALSTKIMSLWLLFGVFLLLLFLVCFCFLFFCFLVLHWPLPEIWITLPSKAQQPQEQCYPLLLVCAVFLCVQTKAWLPVFRIFNLCTDVDACNCTQVLYGHCKSLHWKLTLGEKSLAAPGIQTHISIVLGFSARRCTSWAIPWPISVPYTILGLCMCL